MFPASGMSRRSTTPQLPDVNSWSVDDVVDWLSNQLHLPRHAPKFRRYRVNGVMLARGLSDGFMEKQLGITIRLHRLKIQRSAEQLCGKTGRNCSNSPTRTRPVRSVASAPSKMRPRPRQPVTVVTTPRRAKAFVIPEPCPREHSPLPSPKPRHDVQVRPMNARAERRRRRRRPQNLELEALVNSVVTECKSQVGGKGEGFGQGAEVGGRRSSVSSPVSSLRAKQLSGRRGGRVLGRGVSSPRNSVPNSPANSVRSVFSGDPESSPNSTSSRLVQFQAGSSTTTDDSSSSADDRSQSPGPRHRSWRQQQQQQQQGTIPRKNGERKIEELGQEEGELQGSGDEWRPFSAPIGHARTKYTRRRSLDSEPTVLSTDRPTSTGSTQSTASTFNKYQTPCGETPWTWNQLLQSSDMLIGTWLEKVAIATSTSSSRDDGTTTGKSTWEDELMRVTRSMSDEGYHTVRDLLQDVNEPDFRSDLRSWGMRKRFLNEVMHRLRDMEEAFGVLANRGGNAQTNKGENTREIGDSGNTELSGLWKQEEEKDKLQRQRRQQPEPEPEPEPPSQQLLQSTQVKTKTSDNAKKSLRSPSNDTSPFYVVGRNKKRGLLQKPSNLTIVTPLSPHAAGVFPKDSNQICGPTTATHLLPTINQVSAGINNGRLLQHRPPSLDFQGGSWGNLAQSQSFVITPKGSIVTGPFRIGPTGTVQENEDEDNALSQNSRETMNRTDTSREVKSNDNKEEDHGTGNHSIHKQRPRSSSSSSTSSSKSKPRKRSNSVISSPSGRSIEDELVILRRLGAGAGGVVHKAVHVPSLTVVAVKKIRVFDKSEMRQMRKELEALYKCSAAPTSNTKKEHPGLARARGRANGSTRSSGGGSENESSKEHHNLSTNSNTTSGPAPTPARIRSGSLSPLGQGECPHVVSFYDAFKTSSGDHTISIVLEYMDAGSLQDLINTKMVLPERVVANIGYRVLKGLQFIHSRKIIHRDIKPSNLLLNRVGDVKISDFGIARKLEGTHAMSQSYLGTLMYMAPERINTNSYGKPADIWSVGLSLLTCALGHFPFDAKGGYWALTHAIAIEDLPSFEHLKEQENGGFSDDFVHLIHQCLQKDPAKRATTAELLAHPLFVKHDCEGQMDNTSSDINTTNTKNLIDGEVISPSPLSSSASLDLRASGLESLCFSMSESLLKSTSSLDCHAQQGGDSVSASAERISELDQIAEHVVKYYQRERLTGNFVDTNGKVIGPSTPLKDIDAMDYREWGDPNEISKLYMKPSMLKRFARQLGLPYHMVCRKFDKKAAELMGTDVSSPSFVDMDMKQVLESVDLTRLSASGDDARFEVGASSSSDVVHVVPFHRVISGSKSKELKNKPAGLTVFT